LSFENILLRVDSQNLEDVDRVILNDLLAVTELVDRLMDNYEFQGALLALEHFFRDDYCDWYVEVCKIRLRNHAALRRPLLAVQDCILRHLLQLLSPFIPFVTQELWRQLHFGQEEEVLHGVRRLSAADLGQLFASAGVAASESERKTIGELREVIGAVRGLRPDRGSTLCVHATEEHGKMLHKFEGLILALTHCSSIKNSENPCSAVAITSWGTLAVQGNVGDGQEQLLRELEAIRKNIAANRAKLENKEFLDRAPANVIEGARRLLKENLANEEKILRQFR
jgi:valyl-tRNA synthetase